MLLKYLKLSYIFRENLTLAPELSLILHLDLQNLKSDIRVPYTTIVCQTLLNFSPQNTLKFIKNNHLKKIKQKIKTPKMGAPFHYGCTHNRLFLAPLFLFLFFFKRLFLYNFLILFINNFKVIFEREIQMFNLTHNDSMWGLDVTFYYYYFFC